MLRPETVLSERYVLHQRIAAGGMGEVWRGTDPVLQRTVAIKVLLPALVEDEEFISRFRTEARMMAALRHPGIVQVHDYGADALLDDIPRDYLVMEYIEGEPLAKRIKAAGRLDVAETLSVVVQAAEALHVAHQAGIVHRDVKPSNLLVRPDGTIVLVDFGVARSADVTSVTSTNMVVGSPQYMAPEQVTGQPISAATDIYALGAVAYCCLTGRPPFTGDNPVQVIGQLLHGDPPALPSQIPAPVTELVLRALGKDPADRFLSAADFAEAARAASTSAADPHPDDRPTERREAPQNVPLAATPQPPAAQSLPAAPPALPAAPPAGPPPGPPAGQPLAWSAQPAAGPSFYPQPLAAGAPAAWGNQKPPPPAFPTPAPAFPTPAAGRPASGAGQLPVPVPARGRPVRTATLATTAAVMVGLVAILVAVMATRPGTESAAAQSTQSSQVSAAAALGAGTDADADADADVQSTTSATGPAAGPTGSAALGTAAPQPGRSAALSQSKGAGRPAGTNAGGSDDSGEPAQTAGPVAPAPSTAPAATSAPKPTPTAAKKTTAPKKTTAVANPYTAAQVCGSGYAVIDSASLTKSGKVLATVYLLYNSGNGYNCTVTLKRTSVGTKTAATAHLQVKGKTTATDSGSFAYYAGPVRAKAAAVCVKWGGSTGGVSYTSAFEHCG